MFYGDIDEVVVAPFVERRNLTSPKALMATLPSATKYFIRSSLITMFERTAAGAMARARLILSAVDERATTSVPGRPTKAHTEGCARTRLGPLHAIFLSVHYPIGSVGAPATQPPRDWPMSGAAGATPALFYQNHYMVNPPRKAEMARGPPIMRQIRFKKQPPRTYLARPPPPPPRRPSPACRHTSRGSTTAGATAFIAATTVGDYPQLLFRRRRRCPLRRLRRHAASVAAK